MLCNMIKLLIEQGRTDGLLEKLDVFYLGNRITGEQYFEFVAALGEAEE